MSNVTGSTQNSWGSLLVGMLAKAEIDESISQFNPKPATLKFGRSKHPTGFGEQQQREARTHRTHWSDCMDADRIVRFKSANAPSIDEGLAEYEETRCLGGYTSTKAAYADCTKEYLLSQYSLEYPDEQTMLEQYGRFLLNHGYIDCQETHYFANFVPFEHLPRDGHIPKAWKEFQNEQRNKEYQEHIAFCEDHGMMCDDDLDDYWNADSRTEMELDDFDDMSNFMESNAPAHTYVAPLPADNKVRAWYAGKGKVARLTQRQYTADCGQPVPEGYDSYED